MNTDELIVERGKTHGDWERQSRLSQALKGCIRVSIGNRDFPKEKLEALEMMCVKMARIVCGDHNEADHWRDAAGYAKLGESQATG